MLLDRSAFRFLLLLVGLVGLCLGGCGRKQPAKPSTQPTVPKAAANWQMPTDEECEQFAASLEQIVLSGDLAAFNSAMDWDAILESATGGIEGVETARRGFIVGAKTALRRPGSAGYELIKQVTQGASYRCIRIHVEGNEKRALFRLLGPEGGLNYHDLILARQPDGNVRAVDMYVFAIAERASQTLRRAFLALAAEASKGILGKLTGTESDYVRHAADLRRMADAFQGGRRQQVLDIYSRLPSSLKRDKSVLILRVGAAAELGEQEYTAAMDTLRRYHPRDPCLDLMLIDRYFLQKRYDEALRCVERLDAAVGGDPYLNALRANVSAAQEEYDAAREFAHKAIDADPTLLEAYWALVSVSLATKDFDETSRLLRLIDEKFAVEFADLNEVPEYADYVKSPQYQEWLKSRSPDGE